MIERREFIKSVAAGAALVALPGEIFSDQEETALVVSDEDWSLNSDLILPKFSFSRYKPHGLYSWEGGPPILTMTAGYTSYDKDRKNPCKFYYVWTGVVPMENYGAARKLVLFEMAENALDWAKDLSHCHGMEPGILQCFCSCKTRAIEPGSETWQSRFPIQSPFSPEPEDNEAPWYDIPGICRIKLISMTVGCPYDKAKSE